MRKTGRAIALIPLMVAIGGCSALFPTPQAPSDGLSTLISNEQRNYEVIPLTFDTVREANRRWVYEPKQLPGFLQYGALPAQGGAVRASTLGDGMVVTQAAQSTVTRSSRRLNPPPQLAPSPYLIGPGDVVILTFGGNELIDAAATGGRSVTPNEYSVSGGGSVYHPLIGNVAIGGLTPSAARERIQELVSNQFIDSDVYFDIIEFNSQRVIVASAAGTSEIIPISSRPLTLREAYFRGSKRLPLDETQSFVELYRDGQTYRLRASDVISQTLGYPVYLSDGDYIRVDDPELRELEEAELGASRDRLDIQRDQLRIQQGQFGVQRRGADLADRNFELSRERFEQERRQYEIARQRFELDAAEARRNDQLFTSSERRAEAAELRAQAAERRATRQEARLDGVQQRENAAESRAQRQEFRLDAQERRADSQEQRFQSAEQRAQSAEQRAQAAEARAQRAEGRLDTAENRLQRGDGRAAFGQRLEVGAAGRDRVYVGGEVKTPQLIEMPFERQMSLAEAIFGSNDILPISGDPRKVYVARRGFTADRRDKTYLFQLDLSSLANAPLATAFELRPEDVVYVSPRSITNWNRFVTQILPSVAASAISTGAAIATR